MKKLDSINIEEINKFDFDKINLLIKECQEIKENNPKLFEFFEKYNVSINDLNTKLNKLNIDYENETKKRYNQINERIDKIEGGAKDINNDLINQKINDIDKRVKINEEDIKQLKNIKPNNSNLININISDINNNKDGGVVNVNEKDDGEKKDNEEKKEEIQNRRGNLPIPIDDKNDDNEENKEFDDFEIIDS